MSNEKIYTILGLVALVSGCTTAGFQSTATAQGTGVPVYNTAPRQQQPVAQFAAPAQQQFAQVQQTQAPAAPNPRVELIVQDIEGLQQRMQRLERAMIRLDRRLQLIERNELGRISGNEEGISGDIGPLTQAQNSPYGSQTFEQLAQLNTNVPPQANALPQGFVPVGLRQTAPANYSQTNYAPQQQQPQGNITSALQAAPQQQIAALGQKSQANKKYGLPSLSDEKSQVKSTDISVWTVQYETGKIWPERAQLPGSRDVVEILRSGKPGAIFARGAEPNSRQFRERVRALSKYLGKVSDLSNVAISTMDATHLNPDTIEIFVTR